VSLAFYLYFMVLFIGLLAWCGFLWLRSGDEKE
jgi:hypothetical protein